MAIRSTNPVNRLVQGVRRAALVRAPALLADDQLLEAFIGDHDEAAFEMLVKRHGQMVLGVCRRVIGNRHDAEDAFQAVFLVLARKAGSIVPRDLVANWLYGVAYRTALHARSRLGRHRARERQVRDMPHATAPPTLDLQELHQALDRELHRLAEKYRVPIVLCDLEGRSRKDVAGQLKIPEGTLSSRLAKGREILARRLTRHGVALSAGGMASVLAEQAVTAALVPELVTSTVQAAALAAAGSSAAGVVSANVVALSQGVMKTMFLDKLKVIFVMVLGVVLGGFGVGLFGMPGPNATQAAPPGNPLQFVQTKAAEGNDQEPLDGKLLLDANVQKELRLSKNQVTRIQAISRDVDQKNGDKKREIQGIEKENAVRQKEIEQLRRQIAELEQKISQIQGGIETERAQSVGKAAPEILSAQAVKRLREIQRQRYGLDHLLQVAKVQRMLKMDDEQLKKIETIMKDPIVYYSNTLRLWDVGSATYLNAPVVTTFGSNLTTNGEHKLYWSANVNHLHSLYSTHTTLQPAFNVDAYDKTLRKLFDVLTDSQKQSLLQWVGEPYQSSSWQKLREKQK